MTSNRRWTADARPSFPARCTAAAWVLLGEGIYDSPGAVRRVVVDDDDLAIDSRLREYAGKERPMSFSMPPASL